CFRPVSRYWDRIQRPEQILTSLPEAMRVLTSPAETGAVTLALPQDVQAQAYEFPEEFFQARTWVVSRLRPDAELLAKAADWIRKAKRPLIIAGGGVIYSGATESLAGFAAKTGIPVAETHAGKGSLVHDHAQSVGAMGVTGTSAANILAREADLVIGIGTRYSDFTSASKTAFQNADVRFINVNVAEFDAHKHAALPLVADARIALEELAAAVGKHRVGNDYATRVGRLRDEWFRERERVCKPTGKTPATQAEIIGAVNEFTKAT